MRSVSPELIIDGRWGKFTQGVYSKLPDDVRQQVDVSLEGAGLTAAELWQTHLAEKASNSDSYQRAKAYAREHRAGEVTRVLEAGLAMKPARSATRAEIDEAIATAALGTGVPLNTLHGLVRIESNYRSNAENGSSRGLMQVQPAAWSDASKLVSLPPYSRGVWDPIANATAGAAYAKINEQRLKKSGFSDPITPAVLYLAHQQGAGGFMELWRAAKGLPSISRYVTDRAMLGNPPPDGGVRTVDKAQFFNRWMAYAAKVMSQA